MTPCRRCAVRPVSDSIDVITRAVQQLRSAGAFAEANPGKRGEAMLAGTTGYVVRHLQAHADGLCAACATDEGMTQRSEVANG